MRIQLPGRLLHGGSRRRRVSQKRQPHTASTSAQIQCLDSRVLLSAVTGGTAVFVDSGQTLGQQGKLVLGDLDGDGDTDAFAAHFQPTILLNNGTGTFISGGQTLSNPSSISDVELGDLDGDGDLDAVVAISVAADRRGQILLNDGSGSFIDSGPTLGTAAQLAATLGDLDGDGDLDIIFRTTTYGGPTHLWYNDGFGTFTDGGQVFGRNSSDVALADFDGDGDIDALVGMTTGPSQVWLNNGIGEFTESGTVGTVSYQTASVEDLDGDGDIDVLLTSRSGNPSPAEVWLNDGSANFQDSGQPLGNAATTSGHSQAIGDLDGDGDSDAVIADRSGPDKVWLNNGSGVFADSGQTLGGINTADVALADLDGDGDLDIVTANNQGSTQAWLNQDQPVAGQVNLPSIGGTFEVLVDGGDLVVREQGGDELFRQAQADVPRLQINGSDADDTLIVDFSGGNPIPVSRLEFFAGGQTSEDALILGSGSVTSVSHSFTSDTSGSVIVDGAMISYTGVEPVTDGLTADRRYITYGDVSDDVTLEDNGTGSDGISRISNTATGRTLDFINPSDRLLVNSGAGNDTVTLNAPDALFSAVVSVNGQDGDDLLQVGTLATSVSMTGGTGDDMLIGGMQDDRLDGGAGNDVLNGPGGNEQLYGGSGDDSLLGGSGADLLDGGEGNDRLFGQGGSGDTLTGGNENDVLDGGAGRDWLIENVYTSTNFLTDSEFRKNSSVSQLIGIELVSLTRPRNSGGLIDASGFNGPVTLQGSIGNDTLIGGSQDDSIDGGGGNDSLDGGGGNDTLIGGAGNDSISGGDANDWLDGGDGDDTLNGGSGNDSLTGGFGNDAIAGMSGNDWLNGNRDNDTLLGGDGDDTLLGGGQDDILLGEAGDDFIKGHDGQDLVNGGGQGSSVSANDIVDGEIFGDILNLDPPWAEV